MSGKNKEYDVQGLYGYGKLNMEVPKLDYSSIIEAHRKKDSNGLGNVLIRLIIIIIFVLVAYKIGVHAQIKDNIKHGVMNEQGEWQPEFRMCGYDNWKEK